MNYSKIQGKKTMEKMLVAEWIYKYILDGKFFGERIYHLEDGNYLREQWDEDEPTRYLKCSPQMFEEILEGRKFPFLESNDSLSLYII